MVESQTRSTLLPSTLYPLPSALCPLPSALYPVPSALYHLPRRYPDAACWIAAVLSLDAARSTADALSLAALSAPGTIPSIAKCRLLARSARWRPPSCESVVLVRVAGVLRGQCQCSLTLAWRLHGGVRSICQIVLAAMTSPEHARHHPFNSKAPIACTKRALAPAVM